MYIQFIILFYLFQLTCISNTKDTDKGIQDIHAAIEGRRRSGAILFEEEVKKTLKERETMRSRVSILYSYN